MGMNHNEPLCTTTAPDMPGRIIEDNLQQLAVLLTKQDSIRKIIAALDGQDEDAAVLIRQFGQTGPAKPQWRGH